MVIGEWKNMNYRMFQVNYWFIPYELNWLVVYLPLWKMMEFVSWDNDIPNMMESHKNTWFQTTNR